MITYVAPSDRPLSVLHIPEDGADLEAPAGCEPLTKCGLLMVSGHLWQVIQRRPGDRVCGGCRGVRGRPWTQPGLWPKGGA